jgi:sulfofructose kinase
VSAALDIVGVGLATLDVLVRLAEMPTWQAPGCFEALALDGGGPVGTACVAAARLGARVGFVGTAGSDALAEMKLASFRQAGVDLSRLVIYPGPEHNLVLVYVNAANGERAFAAPCGRAIAPLSPAQLDPAYLAAARYLHLDGQYPEVGLAAARLRRAIGKPVSLDGSKTDGSALSPELRALVAEVDILICGSGFGHSLTGQADLWRAGKAMLDCGPSLVVQTEGEDGCYTFTAGEQFHTPAYPVQVVDTTGAGDVFHGAYLVGLLHGWDLRLTARFASAAAALKCTCLGGRRGIPGFAETLAFMQGQERQVGSSAGIVGLEKGGPGSAHDHRECGEEPS